MRRSVIASALAERRRAAGECNPRASLAERHGVQFRLREAPARGGGEARPASVSCCARIRGGSSRTAASEEIGRRFASALADERCLARSRESDSLLVFG